MLGDIVIMVYSNRNVNGNVYTNRIFSPASPKIGGMDFYGRVRQLVKRKKYPSLQEFILSIGLNQDSYYSLKKAGNLPRADDAIRIAQALETTVEYLVIGNDPKPLTADQTFDEILFLIEKFHKISGRSTQRRKL